MPDSGSGGPAVISSALSWEVATPAALSSATEGEKAGGSVSAAGIAVTSAVSAPEGAEAGGSASAVGTAVTSAVSAIDGEEVGGATSAAETAVTSAVSAPEGEEAGGASSAVSAPDGRGAAVAPPTAAVMAASSVPGVGEGAPAVAAVAAGSEERAWAWAMSSLSSIALRPSSKLSDLESGLGLSVWKMACGGKLRSRKRGARERVSGKRMGVDGECSLGSGKRGWGSVRVASTSVRRYRNPLC